MKKVFRSPAFTGLLFLLALGLLLAGTIGGTRAALTIQSDIYTSQFELTDIGVALTEEGSVIAERDYISEGSWKGNPEGLLMYDISSKCMVERAGDTSLKIGKTYPLPVGVKNTGSIPEYLRVTVLRYWVTPPTAGDRQHGPHGWFDGQGAKRTDLDPSLIEIKFLENSGWTEDTASRTAERNVFYYAGPLDSTNGSQLIESVRVSPNVLKYVREVSAQNGTTQYVYAYDGLGFVIEVQVDAVQNRHSEDARNSAWGKIGPG